MSHCPSAILFDFDGVIVNSEPLHFKAFQLVLKEENIDLSEHDYYQDLIGYDDRGAFRAVFAKHHRELDAKTFLRVLVRKADTVQSMITHRQYSALPGVEALIRGLSHHYPLAICSGALRKEIEEMLEGINLRNCFPVIVSAEDVTIGKPSPEGYLKTVGLLNQHHNLNLSAHDCLVIEDAPSVIRSVNKEGFKTLGVVGSYPANALGDATYIVNQLSPAEVQSKIPKLKIGTET